MTGSVHITDLSASDALRRYAGAEAFRGKGMAETMKKVMRFWVDFATAKIPKGDPAKVESDLKAVVAGYSRLGGKRGKAADAWRGTYASRIVAMIDWQGARKLKGAAFYAAVRRFVAKRKFASNLHRSGMRPAFLALRGKIAKAGRLPQFQNQPGGYSDSVKEAITEILVENWARAGGPKSVGITGPIAGKNTGEAFAEAIAQVDALLTKFLEEDIRKQAERAGFTAA